MLNIVVQRDSEPIPSHSIHTCLSDTVITMVFGDGNKNN